MMSISMEQKESPGISYRLLVGSECSLLYRIDFQILAHFLTFSPILLYYPRMAAENQSQSCFCYFDV